MPHRVFDWRSALAKKLQHPRWRSQRVTVLLALCLMLWNHPIGAQEAPVAGAIAPPTVAEVQAKIDRLAAAEDIGDKDRERATQIYNDALEQLQQSAELANKTLVYERALQQAPLETAKSREALAVEPPQAIIPTGSDLQSMEALLGRQQAEAASADATVLELDRQISAMQSRPDAARAELVEARQALGEMTQNATAPAVAATPLADAERVAFAVTRLAAERRIVMLEVELASHDARLDLLDARHALAKREQQAVQSQVAELQLAINSRRRSETAAAIRDTEVAARQAADKAVVVRNAIDANGRLSRDLASLVKQIDAVSELQENTGRRLHELGERYDSVRQQLEIAGVSGILGPVLLQERQTLPDVAQYQRAAQEREQQIAEARLQQFQVNEQRRKAGSVSVQIEALSAARPNTAAMPQSIRDELTQLLNDRRQLRNQLSAGYGSYVGQLVKLDQSERELVAIANRYATLLDENLFWTANSKPITGSWLKDIGLAQLDLLRPSGWHEVVSVLRAALQKRPGLVTGAWVFWLLIVIAGSRLRHRLKPMASQIGSVKRDTIALTVEALATTVLLAIRWPALIALIGLMLVQAGGERAFARGIGTGLLGAAVFALGVTYLRQLCRYRGLAELHLRWPQPACMRIKRNLVWYAPIGLAASFLVSLGEYHADVGLRDSIGRFAFLVGSLAFAAFIAIVLHPRRGVLQHYLADHPGVAWQVRLLFFPIAVIVPVALAVVALAGYYYSALQLESRYFFSGWLLLEAVVVNGLVLRWLRVEQRRLAYKRALAKREAILAAREKEGAQAAGEGVPELLESEIVDLDTISEQSRGLLLLLTIVGVVIGLWFVWSDLLPAFTGLNEFVLWRQAVTVDGIEQSVAITLANLLASIAILIILLLVARDLPGLLEIAVLRRLPFDAGSRYATTSIIRYLIVVVGILTALGNIGIGWEKAQWLVAAVGVGLGFGLQELFANFVSGLIILLERPVRVGDTVTLGEYSGTVTRIRIRATTIMDWDRKEIVIPNKTFLNESLTNWTLTDPVTRVVIPIGVAYGSDTVEVHRTLLEVANAHPLVLGDPPPAVLLLGFGDSALNFEVRVFVRELADRLPLIHDLHGSIASALAANDIEIPFPQRDLHLRDLPAALRDLTQSAPKHSAPWEQPGRPAAT